MDAISSFDEVVALLASGTVRTPRGEWRTKSPLDLVRFEAVLDVGCKGYDAFFNSPVGYRAQYCLGVEFGLKQNRQLIDLLTDACLASLSLMPDPDLPPRLAQASLAGQDSKIWIRDEDLPATDEIHIDYFPWVAKARAAFSGSMTDQAARANATAGVLAPLHTRLELKGAWVSDSGVEWRDPTKANRAYEIRDYGYT